MAGTKSLRWLRRLPGRVFAAVALLVWLATPLAAIAQATDTATIVGDYSVVIAVEDVPKDVANGPALFGRWRISFRADGTYGTVRIDIGPMVSGTYTVEGDQLTVTDESGLLSCGNASIVGDEPDAATGTYQWTRTDDRLNLVPIQDNCAGRRILFATRQLSGFVACATQASPSVSAPSTAGTPQADGTPVGTPIAEPPPAVSTDTASPEPVPPQSDAEIAQAIDALLDQMTSCWATGQPELFLPLMTDAFRSQFLQQADGTADPIAALASLMASTPFVWERTGDVDVIDPTHATALVRQAVNNQEDFVRYAFEFEHGAWRWAGAG
jgi:hypothetical protein